MKEEWRDVRISEGLYQISNKGRIKSFQGKNPRILKPRISSYGYHVASLYLNKKPVYIRVHRLVMQEFVGDIPEGYQVNHKDANKSNNSVDNLEYCTPSQNIIHSYSLGLQKTKRGANHPRARLTEAQAKALKYDVIPNMKSAGITFKELAKVWGVSDTTLCNIKTERTWKHI
jgi:hypothetical protein